MTTNRIRKDAGFCDESKLEKGPEGRNLCRWCRKEVPKGRRTFCGPQCIHEWKIRTNPGYVRDEIFARDLGVCAACRIDTDALAKRIKQLSHVFHYGPADKRIQAMADWETLKIEKPWTLGKRSIYSGRLPSLWQADHIVPVCEGGGECGLEGYRTLCTPCHAKETKALAARRAAAKRQETV